MQGSTQGIMTLQLWLDILTVGIAGIAAITGIVALSRIREVHVSLNSRLSELVRSTHAQGMLQGAKQEREKSIKEE